MCVCVCLCVCVHQMESALGCHCCRNKSQRVVVVPPMVPRMVPRMFPVVLLPPRFNVSLSTHTCIRTCVFHKYIHISLKSDTHATPAQLCEHGRSKSRCKDCGGKSICEHNRRRNQCKVPLFLHTHTQTHTFTHTHLNPKTHTHARTHTHTPHTHTHTHTYTSICPHSDRLK